MLYVKLQEVLFGDQSLVNTLLLPLEPTDPRSVDGAPIINYIHHCHCSYLGLRTLTLQ